MSYSRRIAGPRPDLDYPKTYPAAFEFPDRIPKEPPVMSTAHHTVTMPITDYNLLLNRAEQQNENLGKLTSENSSLQTQLEALNKDHLRQINRLTAEIDEKNQKILADAQDKSNLRQKLSAAQKETVEAQESAASVINERIELRREAELNRQNPFSLYTPVGFTPSHLTMQAIKLIAEERIEQVAVNGYPPHRDLEINCHGELVKAACCIAAPEELYCIGLDGPQRATLAHYWPHNWRKDILNRYSGQSGPSRIKALSVAGALIAAELDRLLRTQP